jgi:hypothetical protein
MVFFEVPGRKLPVMLLAILYFTEKSFESCCHDDLHPRFENGDAEEYSLTVQ